MNGSADRRRTGAAPQSARQPWEAPPKVPALPWRTRWSIRLDRARRWEFWPAWLYYLPIVAWILLLGLRHLRPTVFTAANSALDAGGVVGEHKFQALAPLQHNAPDLAAVCTRIAAGDGPLRHTAALRFAEVHGYPVVLKPDIGQRGRGVFIARNAAAVHDYLARFNGAVIAQQYIDGDEFGIFIARMPDQPQVQVLSIVHKTFPQVTGDGQRSLQQLILDDARARLIADTLFARWAEDLQRVPDSGESIALVEIGAHCRGSLFLDATARVTPALVATLTRLADAVPGYAFGRLDLRAPSIEHLQRGDGLRVLELNGVTAESAHIYHPGTPLLVGYADMFRQWALAFRIGAARARDGAPVTGPVELLRRFVTDLARARQWF